MTTWLRTSTMILCCASACGAAQDDNHGTTTSGGTSAGSTSGASTQSSASATTEGGPTAAETAPVDTSSDDASGGASTTATTTDATTGTDVPGPDLRLRGPHEVETTPGMVTVGGGCSMPYDTFAPVDVADAPTVILAHGFQGNRGSMVGWADHWASWGLVVVTPNLCHASIIDADHAQNGADLVTLAEHLDVGPVALAGYSAGGLAAVIAAAARPDTPVLLGLDMVDAGGLGADASPGITAPAHDITSETAMCNSSSNGVPVFGAIPGSDVVRLVDADHCDFQNPGDNFCNLCAAANEVNTPEAIQAAIFGLSTAALLWRLGVEPTGAQWWTPGAPYYDELFVGGLLVQL